MRFFMPEIKLGTIFIKDGKLKTEYEKGIEVEMPAENIQVITVSNENASKDKYISVGNQIIYKLSSEPLK